MSIVLDLENDGLAVAMRFVFATGCSIPQPDTAFECQHLDVVLIAYSLEFYT